MKPFSAQSLNIPKMEEDILSFWEKEQIFYKTLSHRKNSKEFLFYDGPPFANGLPHYGHILASTVKDVVPRYWTMKGFYVERKFGWDCHGLPVEFEIEKRENLKGRKDILKLGVEKFNEMCRSSVLRYTEEWQKTIARAGRWVDWKNQYKTMDKTFMESVWWVFCELNKKGLVYKDYKVVPYSPRITAVLSNFEANQNYKDVNDPSVTVKFKLLDEDAFVLAWTTTPWTLVSNLALCVHPDEEYVKVLDTETKEHYYLASKRMAALAGKNKDRFTVLKSLKGTDLEGRSYKSLFDYFLNHKNAFQILCDSYVTMDDGTGVVHQAPAFGEDDFRVCKKAGIELVDPLDEEGSFVMPITDFLGQNFKDADKEIIKKLKIEGKIFKHETLTHSYPFCERTDTPLMFRAIPAWYVAVEKFRDLLVKNNQTINWVPHHLKDGRMGKWLEQARDWAVSRNRFWGTPIPVWQCSEKPNEHLQFISSSKELEEKTGNKVDDLHKDKIDSLTFKCEKCQGSMKRISEVFDCWFESGSMPYAQMHYPFEHKDRFEKSFPADFIAEGLDQTRGWFYTLSVLSTALFKKPAFKNVVVNGIILDENGRKMSKRHRNYTPPDELLHTMGADATRLYMLNSAILRGEDLIFLNQGVKDIIRSVILPFYHSYSFLATYSEADGWQPDSDLSQNKRLPKAKGELDRWILSRLNYLTRDVEKEMNSYTLYNVVPKILSFVDDLTNWYIRLSRRRFWGTANDDEETSFEENIASNVKKEITEETLSAYETLFYVLKEFSKVLAPFAPFCSETIYQRLMDNFKDSVHLQAYPVFNGKLFDQKLYDQMELVRQVTVLGRSLRAKHKLKTRQALSRLIVVGANKAQQENLSAARALVCEELNVKNLEFSDNDDEFVEVSLKANLKTLGPLLGKNIGEFRKKVEELSKDQKRTIALLKELEAKGETEVFGQKIKLNDLLIDRKSNGQNLVASDKGITVVLDANLTKDLILEGLAREAVSRIQKTRKEEGLNVSDRLDLHLSCDNEDLFEALNIHKAYISSEVLAEKLSLKKEDKASTGLKASKSFDLEGKNLNVAFNVV